MTMWMVWGQRDNVYVYCIREEFRFNKRNETKYKKLFVKIRHPMEMVGVRFIDDHWLVSGILT